MLGGEVMKKLLVILITVIMTIVCMSVVFTGCQAYNKQIVDLTYNFDYAWIEIPDGTVVQGKVESWKDYKDGDQIQVKIDGKTYLTDTTRCVLRSGS